MKDLTEILNNEDADQRRRQLIERGWLLQRAEARTNDERDWCDWMLMLARRESQH